MKIPNFQELIRVSCWFELYMLRIILVDDEGRGWIEVFISK